MQQRFTKNGEKIRTKSDIPQYVTYVNELLDASAMLGYIGNKKNTQSILWLKRRFFITNYKKEIIKLNLTGYVAP